MNTLRALVRLVLFVAAFAPAAGAETGWWMREPIRWLQVNLRQIDSGLDPEELVTQVAELRANVLHLGMGGIVAHYPSSLEFHYHSPYLPGDRDTFGEVLRRAHARGIRVVGRFDFSKVRKEAAAAHPEWFFRQANGEPVEYNGLYSTCINGGYYRDYAMRILAEALGRYEVDGLFFNMFGNQSRDYSGRFVGHCHCDACRAKFRAMFGGDLPSDMNSNDYRQFLFRTSREVAAEIQKLIRTKRPAAGFFNYIQEYTDGVMSESNTGVDRPLPLWPYSASDNVNRNRNSQPAKMAVNLCMQFVDYAWRWVTVPGPEIQLRLWQNVAHGGAAAFAINGTFAQEDRQGLEAARPVFQWLASHERHFVGQENDAGVLLYRGGANQASYRGLFRFLTEEHIPFAATDNLEWIGRRPVNLVMAAGPVPVELGRWVEAGGRLLLATPRPPPFEIARVVKPWNGVRGHLRIRDPGRLPSLASTNVLMLDGDFLELEPVERPLLTLVPPSMFGPPEFIHIDAKDTTIPGVAQVAKGRGRVTWLPWDLGGLYQRHSLSGHRGLLRDLVDELLEGRRELRTNAHPLAELVWMKQGPRRLLHLVNVSGHADTAYFPPVPMSGIDVSVEGTYSKARAVRAGLDLPLTRSAGRTDFTVPKLADYELVLVEP